MASISTADLNTSVQKELQEFIDTHDLNRVMSGIVEHVLMEQPENVPQCIVDYLAKTYPDDVSAPVATDGTAHPEVPSSGAPLVPAAGAGEPPAASDAESESESDDDDDYVDELPTFSAERGGRRRTSVSAESDVDPRILKAQWETDRKVYPKTDHEKREIRRIMREAILFQGLDDKNSDVIVDAFSPLLIRDGSTIIKQGDTGDLFYVVADGAPEVFIDANGRTSHIVTYAPGDSFGELALMYNAPRAATVKAKGDCRLWALDRLTFKVILMEAAVNKRKKYEAFLARVPILSTLTDYERSVITDAIHEVSFKAGQVICAQGEPGDRFYIVERGEISITQTASDGGPSVEVMRCKIGSYFGEIALLTDSPRKATATAVLPSQCLTLDRKTFSRVMGPLKNILKRNIAQYSSIMKEVDA